MPAIQTCHIRRAPVENICQAAHPAFVNIVIYDHHDGVGSL